MSVWMKVYKHVDLVEWLLTSTWSGASDWIKELSLDEVERLAEHLSCVFTDCEGEDRGTSDTDLNDFIWFEVDTWSQWLGYEDAEDLLNSKNC